MTASMLSGSLSSELDHYIRNNIPLLDFAKNMFFVVLTPNNCVKWANNLSKSYYNLTIDSELKQRSEIFNDVLKHLKNLNKITLPVMQFETLNPLFPGETIKWSASYLENQRGTTIGIMLVGKIYQEEINQKKINYLQTCLNTMLDTVPGSVYWKNKEGIYLGCNEALLKKGNFGSKQDIIGKTDQELWPEFSEELAKRDKEVILFDKTIEYHENVKLRSGDTYHFLSIKTPLKDESDNIIGVVGNSLDITEIVESKKKVEEANNIKAQFLLNMQHDIKTPISHIIGLTEVLSTMDGISEKAKEYIGYISLSSKKLMGFMVDMLRFADLESEAMPKREWKLDLKEIIQKTVDLYIIPIKKKNLEINLDYDNSISYTLTADRDRLQKIILNLFDNALKFTEKGTIRIATKVAKVLPDSNIILEVSITDSGIGISKDKHEQIFDRFTRLSPSSANKYPGYGLGLWMVKKLLEEMNGEISVDSEIGVGTKFTCLFPCRMTLMGN